MVMLFSVPSDGSNSEKAVEVTLESVLVVFCVAVPTAVKLRVIVCA
jgi:hypothetical protein